MVFPHELAHSLVIESAATFFSGTPRRPRMSAQYRIAAILTLSFVLNVHTLLAISRALKPPAGRIDPSPYRSVSYRSTVTGWPVITNSPPSPSGSIPLRDNFRFMVDKTDEADEHDDIIARAIARAVGEELRIAREHANLSQIKLAARLGLHVRTIGAYEQGERHCTVARLCEIARTIGASPDDILARALHRVNLDMQTVRLCVDLTALARDNRPELRQLRRWAKRKLATYPDSTMARLDGSAIREIAIFIGGGITKVTGQLAMFALSSHDNNDPD
jgi:transcriptional regulator with XRE-family HTH domain